MCKKTRYKKTSNTQIDKCMREEIKKFNQALKLLEPYLRRSIEVVGCCCGHGEHPKTIIVRQGANTSYESIRYFEHFSGVEIPRIRKFYKKDDEGYYFIPEVNQSKQEICECGHKQWDEHKCTFEPMVAQECNVKGCRCKKFKLHKPEVKKCMEVSADSSHD